MKTKYIDEVMTYTGEQLRSNFAYTEFDIIGDSIIAFCGPCDIPIEKMVDLEDVKGNAKIYSESMVHFIVEHHNSDLEKGVLRQIVLATIICEVINESQPNACIKRLGSDLYDNEAKLSISVATQTPISSVIHFGVNITSDNTPVKTRGLKEYGIDPCDFAESVMAKYKEMESDMHLACCKVRWRA
jgi:hypothetical protein